MDVLLSEWVPGLLWAWGQPGWRAVLMLGGAILAAGFIDRVLGGMLSLLARRTHSPLDDELITVVRRPLALVVLLGGIWAASAPLTGTLRFFIDGMSLSLIVLLGTMVTLQASGLLLRQASHRAPYLDFSLVQPRTLPLFEISIKAFLLGGCGYFLLLAWGIDPSGWLASAGVVGIAVGFAAKDSLANLFAGLFIIADAPYRLGDYIQLDGGMRGEVTEIGIRSTRIKTRDEIEIILPNAVMASARIINETIPNALERIRCGMVVPYSVDPDEVRQLLIAAADTVPALVLDDPQRRPRVRFRSYEDHGLRLELLAWIRQPAERGMAMDALIVASFCRLRAAGIDIASPRTAITLRGPDAPAQATLAPIPDEAAPDAPAALLPPAREALRHPDAAAPPPGAPAPPAAPPR